VYAALHSLILSLLLLAATGGRLLGMEVDHTERPSDSQCWRSPPAISFARGQ
jgi:hypothetical protein